MVTWASTYYFIVENTVNVETYPKKVVVEILKDVLVLVVKDSVVNMISVGEAVIDPILTIDNIDVVLVVEIIKSL